MRALNKGPLPAEALSRLYIEIMSACRALETGLTVAYLGPQGTFSEEAVVKHFGKSVTGLACGSIDETFQSVESGAASYGVVPIENSTEGAVGRTNDLLFQRPVLICGEVMLPVHQCLMNLSGRPDGFSKIYSHSQSLAQCRGWLNSHYQRVERVAVVSNAEAARLASLEEGAAAVAGRIAAERYGLEIVAQNIEDESRNITRFVVIGSHDAGPTGQDRTSLVMSTRNRPGAMNELLVPLAEHQVSMSRLESRPARSGLWEYLFFVDIEGHRNGRERRQGACRGRRKGDVRENARFLSESRGLDGAGELAALRMIGGGATMDICDFSPAYVRAIAPYQPGKPISELARELGLNEADIIKLASNENPLGISPKAAAAIPAAVDELARYPDGSGYELKQALAAHLRVAAENIVLGNGSNDVLEMVAAAFLRPGTKAVYSQHAFAVYPLATQARGAQGIVVPARDYGHDLEAMLRGDRQRHARSVDRKPEQSDRHLHRCRM